MSEKEIASLRELIQANAISDLNHFEANERRIERIENNIDYARFEIQTQKIEVLKKKLLNIESVHDVFVDVMDKQTKFEKILWTHLHNHAHFVATSLTKHFRCDN